LYKANFGTSGTSGISASLGQKHLSASVAIISHNYGKYLAQAIRSVLAQTLKPERILVIDDNSTDNTEAVAKSFAARGVEYLRVHTGNVWENRLTAFRELESEWVLCLDADNYLLNNYLEEGVKAGRSSDTCGIVRMDLLRFGTESRLLKPSQKNLWATNHVDAGSIYRREAVLQQDMGSVLINPMNEAEDWLLARKVCETGWTLAQNPVPLMYRKHNDNKHVRRLARTRDYYHDASLRNEPVTLICLLSGRWNCLRDTCRWLGAQTWPRRLCRLVMVDNSNDPSFGEQVRQWLTSSGYRDFRYIESSLGERGLGERRREGQRETSRKVNQVVAAHYNRAIHEASTEYIFSLEDDVFPERFDAIQHLLFGMSHDVAGVTGAYPHRDSDRWLAWTGTGAQHTYPEQLGEGIKNIDGCGFGCFLFRKSAMSQQKLVADAKPTIFFDCNGCDSLRQKGWKLRINWDVVCEHRAGVHV